MLLAIDPGVTTGWALYSNGNQLLGCGLDDPQQCRWLVVSALSRVVIEQPRIYPGGRTKSPNDVLSVAVNAGEWAGRFKQQGCAIEYVTPSTWKGQVKKDISHARIWAKLWVGEQQIVDAAGKGMPASKRHNMLDAVGIGLWAVDR